MTTNSRILSGSTISLYTGDVGATATTITATDGSITPSSTDWTLMGQGKYDDGVRINPQDERTQLRFQGSQGIPSEERRSTSGLLVTIPVFDTTPQTMALAWGNAVTTTAAASGQVGIHRVNLDLPLLVPEVGVQFVIDSPFDEDGTEGWLGLIYVPKATLRFEEINLATDPEAVSCMVRQLKHTSDAYWETVFADATA